MTGADISSYPESPAVAGASVLEVDDLHVEFRTRENVVNAVNGVSYTVSRGETLAILGESGSGKSVSAQAIMGILDTPPAVITGGGLLFEGRDLLTMSDEERRRVRGPGISMIFQDALSSLNPVYSVGFQIGEMFRAHRGVSRKEAKQRAVELMDRVRIPAAAQRVNDYPHQFSGGMRQRVMIAMALSCKPELLIADEPTTALDVTIQAQILELIKKIKDETGTSVILITHDLGVVAGTTDHVAVMYAGKIMERAPTLELFARPGNPYTKGLLASVPDPSCEERKDLYQIPGLPPDVAHLGPGCPFAPRCLRAEQICRDTFPPFVELTPTHHSLCHFAREVYATPGLNS